MAELISLDSLSQVFIVIDNSHSHAQTFGLPSSSRTADFHAQLTPLLSEIKCSYRCVSSVEEIIATFQPNLTTISCLRIMMVFVSECSESSLSLARESFPTVFIAVFNPRLSTNPFLRLEYHKQGVNQVAYTFEALLKVIEGNILIARSDSSTAASTALVAEDGTEAPANTVTNRYKCHFCPMQGLTEDELWRHLPAYHINIPNDAEDPCTQCPICNKTSERPMLVHVFEGHGPVVRQRTALKSVAMQRITQLYHFSLVVCKHPQTGHYLLSQEFGDQGFWLPGGAVEPGENFTAAAHRKFLEQSGVSVDIRGILAMEMHPFTPLRMRVIFYAEPTAEFLASGGMPKSVPDFESVGACWVSVTDLERGLKLRGNEPLVWSRYIEGNGPIFPLSILKERPC